MLWRANDLAWKELGFGGAVVCALPEGVRPPPGRNYTVIELVQGDVRGFSAPVFVVDGDVAMPFDRDHEVIVGVEDGGRRWKFLVNPDGCAPAGSDTPWTVQVRLVDAPRLPRADDGYPIRTCDGPRVTDHAGSTSFGVYGASCRVGVGDEVVVATPEQPWVELRGVPASARTHPPPGMQWRIDADTWQAAYLKAVSEVGSMSR